MTKRLLALVALPLLAALFVAAAPLPSPVQTVRIAVVDPDNGDELTMVSPGEEIVMIPGEELLFRIFEPKADRRNDRRPLAATFGFGPTNSPLEIVASSPERGEVRVRLNPTPAGGRWHLGYKLADRIGLAKSNMQLGRVLVRVAGTGSTSVTGAHLGQTLPISQFARPADAVIDALYRGILLRAPDEGAAGARNDLLRNGYSAVPRIAEGIANSPESRSRIYDDKGVDNARRLDALYSALLGWSRADVGRERWESDLAQLDRGNVAGVVDAIVRSQQFRERFGI
jgi:hypothetical protein